MRATGFDFGGVGDEIFDPAQRVQLIADDFHVWPLGGNLPLCFFQNRLAKAVVLANQVNAFGVFVAREHIHQCGHAHVGMGVKPEVPVAALFIRQRRVDCRIIQENHALGRLAFVVFVDRVNQHGRGG